MGKMYIAYYAGMRSGYEHLESKYIIEEYNPNIDWHNGDDVFRGSYLECKRWIRDEVMRWIPDYHDAEEGSIWDY